MNRLGEQSSGKPHGGSEGEELPEAAAQDRAPNRKSSQLTRLWAWVQRDKVASVVVAIAVVGLFAAVSYCYLLGAQVAALKEKHQEDVERIEKRHSEELEAAEAKAEHDLKEFKCQLYDQALARFNERCKWRGLVTDHGTCEYNELIDGQRYEVFYPPAQGLDRLCEAGAIP